MTPPDTTHADALEPVVHIVDAEAHDRIDIANLVTKAGLTARLHPDAEALLDTYDPDRPGCVVTELRLPGMSGLELLCHVRSLRIDASNPVIVVTAYGDVTSVRQALKAGAFDFIEKPIARPSFLRCVDAALKQDRETRRRDTDRRVIRSLIATLTPRERQIMRLVVAGQTTKTIAATLDLSPKTVDFHRANIMAKMQNPSVAKLVRMCLTAELP